jgi:hypothetical protein
MTFIEALAKAKDEPNSIETRVFRPDGPALIITELGMIWDENGLLYLGDILDLDDWQVEPVQ